MLIGLISAYDTFWIVRLQDTIHEEELNPVGCLILHVSDVSYFVMLKMAGTILAMGFLVFLHYYWPKTAMKVVVPLLVVQICVFVYLVGVDHTGLVEPHKWVILPSPTNP